MRSFIWESLVTVGGMDTIVPWGPSDKISLKLFSYCTVDGFDVNGDALPSDGTSADVSFISEDLLPVKSICSSKETSLYVGTKISETDPPMGLAIVCQITAGPPGENGITDAALANGGGAIEIFINIGVEATICC